MNQKIIKILTGTAFLTIILGCQIQVSGQENRPQKFNIKWGKPLVSVLPDGTQKTALYFENASISEQYKTLPVFGVSFSGKELLHATLSDEIYEDFPEQNLVPSDYNYATPSISIVNGIASRKSIGGVSFIPVRRQGKGTRAERLVSFTLNVQFSNSAPKKIRKKIYKDHSVLAGGKWYKMGVTSSGVYKLTYNDLLNLGIDVSSTPSSRFKIYGMNGGMLPQENSAFRHDDLYECALLVNDGGNGKIEPGDALLFYADAPHTYQADLSQKIFTILPNTYSDSLFYFLTTEGASGKRVKPAVLSQQNPTRVFTNFNAVLSRNDDKYNLIKSGREWYGDNFDFATERSYDFNLAGMSSPQTLKVTGRVIGRSEIQSNFDILINGISLGLLTCGTVKLSDYDGLYGVAAMNTFPANSSALSSTEIKITFRYDKPLSTSVGYVDYMVINYKKELNFIPPQMEINTLDNIGNDSISEYQMRGVNTNTIIWEITHPMDPSQINYTVSGSMGIFKINTDTLKKFVAFDPAQVSAPYFLGVLPNQDLHGLTPPDLLIIAPREFSQKDNPESPAIKYATYKRKQDGFTVEIVSPAEIYNEFSSGRLDITAIRDFIKMLYDKSEPPSEHHLQYVLLMGDASYDYKNKLSGNINHIPTYEAYNSLNHIGSFASDDFYSFMDEDEGRWKENGVPDIHLMDVAIGRIPARNYSEALGVVNKIISYSTDPKSKGEWRKNILFIADDADNSEHQKQADSMAEKIFRENPELNVKKLYLAAFPQTAAGGKDGKAPLMNEEIIRTLNEGVLVFNYTGHGGEVGFAHERILETADILALRNKEKLPFYITASCELSRFDDPDRVSIGEWVLLNPQGGGIGLASTTRVVFSGENFTLNKTLIDSLMFNQNNTYKPIGDVFKATKNKLWSESIGIINSRNFTLLGDPSMRLSFPKGKIIITKIYSNNDTTKTGDTLKALCLVTMEGEVQSGEGVFLNDFNGRLSSIIFEKRSVIPLQPDQGVDRNDSAQTNIIYKGDITVIKGKFVFSFMVPKDISYKLGRGKVSLYANTDTFDASGYRNVQIGGSCPGIKPDNEGPSIKLYLNDETFVRGGITASTPDIYAILYDQSGVNRVGMGIGHEIVIIIDGNINQPKILNNFYTSKQDDYQSGEVRYKLQNLTPGPHTVKLRVWDVHNNPSEAETDFVVSTAETIQLQHVYNYPNPFSTKTQFIFEHNHYGDDLEVQIDIFTVSGKRIKTISRYIAVSPSLVKDFYWDGMDDEGDKLARGLYFYRLRAKSVFDGSEESTFQKLVILR